MNREILALVKEIEKKQNIKDLKLLFEAINSARPKTLNEYTRSFSSSQTLLEKVDDLSAEQLTVVYTHLASAFQEKYKTAMSALKPKLEAKSTPVERSHLVDTLATSEPVTATLTGPSVDPYSADDSSDAEEIATPQARRRPRDLSERNTIPLSFQERSATSRQVRVTFTDPPAATSYFNDDNSDAEFPVPLTRRMRRRPLTDTSQNPENIMALLGLDPGSEPNGHCPPLAADPAPMSLLPGPLGWAETKYQQFQQTRRRQPRPLTPNENRTIDLTTCFAILLLASAGIKAASTGASWLYDGAESGYGAVYYALSFLFGQNEVTSIASFATIACGLKIITDKVSPSLKSAYQSYVAMTQAGGTVLAGRAGDATQADPDKRPSSRL